MTNDNDGVCVFYDTEEHSLENLIARPTAVHYNRCVSPSVGTPIRKNTNMRTFIRPWSVSENAHFS